jgi:hypothetical protein
MSDFTPVYDLSLEGKIDLMLRMIATTIGLQRQINDRLRMLQLVDTPAVHADLRQAGALESLRDLDARLRREGALP